jgi:hypothetical protein
VKVHVSGSQNLYLIPYFASSLHTFIQFLTFFLLQVNLFFLLILAIVLQIIGAQIVLQLGNSKSVTESANFHVHTHAHPGHRYVIIGREKIAAGSKPYVDRLVTRRGNVKVT